MPNPSRPFRPLPQVPRPAGAIRTKVLLGVPPIALPLAAVFAACVIAAVV